MIKLIATDIDGTLVKEGSQKIDPLWYETVQAIKDRGIAFAVASGRQYKSLREMFAPVSEDMYFVSENGTNVMQNGKTVFVDQIDPEAAKETVRVLRTLPNCTAMVSTPEMMYIDTRNPELERFVLEGYRYNLKIVDDLLPICEHTNKMCVYVKGDIEETERYIFKKVGDRVRVMRSGDVWIDFIDLNSDKGAAIRRIQKKLGITAEETAAFGDNFNDIGLLKCATASYAVETAHDDVKNVAAGVVPSFEEQGVLRKVREWLREF